MVEEPNYGAGTVRTFVRNTATGFAIELKWRTPKQRKSAALIIAKMLNRFCGEVSHGQE